MKSFSVYFFHPVRSAPEGVERALEHLLVEWTNLHQLVLFVHEGPAVLDLMGARRSRSRDTVVRTIRRNLSPCSCCHPVRSVAEVAARAL